MTWSDFVIRLLMAFILGAAIGVERQWQRTRAVLKTNVLVSLGSAMFVMLSAMIPGDASPTRIAAQVVSGIGFLGGGVILRQGANVKGLNTAATLWCAAAVGSLIGAGFLFQAYVGALAVVGANLLLRPIVNQIAGQSVIDPKPETRYRCRVICQSEDEAEVRALLLKVVQEGALMMDAFYSKDLGSKDLVNPSRVELKADFVSEGRNDLLLEQVISIIKLQVKVSAVSWELVSEESE